MGPDAGDLLLEYPSHDPSGAPGTPATTTSSPADSPIPGNNLLDLIPDPGSRSPVHLDTDPFLGLIDSDFPPLGDDLVTAVTDIEFKMVREIFDLPDPIVSNRPVHELAGGGHVPLNQLPEGLNSPPPEPDLDKDGVEQVVVGARTDDNDKLEAAADQCPSPQSNSSNNHSSDNNDCDETASHMTGSSAPFRDMIQAERCANPGSPSNSGTWTTGKRRNQTPPSSAPTPPAKRVNSRDQQFSPHTVSNQQPGQWPEPRSYVQLQNALTANQFDSGSRSRASASFSGPVSDGWTQPVSQPRWFNVPSDGAMVSSVQSYTSAGQRPVDQMRNQVPQYQPHVQQRFAPTSRFSPQSMSTHTLANPSAFPGNQVSGNRRMDGAWYLAQQRQLLAPPPHTLTQDMHQVSVRPCPTSMDDGQSGFMPAPAIAPNVPHYWNPGQQSISPVCQPFQNPEPVPPCTCMQCLPHNVQSRATPVVPQHQQTSGFYYPPTQSSSQMTTQPQSLPHPPSYTMAPQTRRLPPIGQLMNRFQNEASSNFLIEKPAMAQKHFQPSGRSPAVPMQVTISDVPEADVSGAASVSPQLVSSNLEIDEMTYRPPVDMQMKWNSVNRWLSSLNLSEFFPLIPYDGLPPLEEYFYPPPPVPVYPPFLCNSGYKLSYVCPKGCQGFNLPCLYQEEQEQQLRQLAQRNVVVKVEGMDDKNRVPKCKAETQGLPVKQVAVPSCVSGGGDVASAPIGRHNIPLVAVDGVVAPKRTTTDRESYCRPRPFEMDMLEIGNFRIDQQNYDNKRYSTKVKIVPAKKRIIYEFPVVTGSGPGSKAEEDEGPLSPQSQPVAYAMMVPFSIITGLNADKKDKKVYLTVSHSPLLFSSDGSNRNAVSFDKTSSADPSCGQMSHNRLHRIQLRGAAQIDRFITSLIEFYPQLLDLYQIPVNTDIDFHRTAERLPEVDDA